jgi:catechol-2,3-dioxygenase
MHIQELTLQTDDLDAQATFYREVLRLPVELAAERLQVTIGRSRLIFKHQPGWRGAYHFAFDVPENQFEAAGDWLTERTKLIELNGQSRFHSDGWNADMIYFRDAAGNILELIARHQQANATTHPFSEFDLLAITEIGLGTRDVRSTVGQLMTELGVRTYDGGGSSSFSAVGDEQGLFIVVHHEREWYPQTGQRGGLHPMTVRLGQPNALVQVENGVIRINQRATANRIFEVI